MKSSAVTCKMEALCRVAWTTRQHAEQHPVHESVTRGRDFANKSNSQRSSGSSTPCARAQKKSTYI